MGQGNISERAGPPNLLAQHGYISNSDLVWLSMMMKEKTGIVLGDRKKDLIHGRLLRRLRALDIISYDEYFLRLRSGHLVDEMEHLINALTTNLTSFFRERHHFIHLAKSAIPSIASTGGKLRIWSAGCSTGEEAYSIAMVLANQQRISAVRDAKILATDIDTEVLNKGALGCYHRDAAATIPLEYGDRFTRIVNGKLTMNESIRGLIRFLPLNLLDAWPMAGKFNAIFCRNVLIYFDPPTQEKICLRFADLLAPGGWLYLGHSENFHDNSGRFEISGRTIFRKK
jgi:chemotaxis protein methyltransferase CheR